jgi:hypothetical protein
MCLFIQSLSGLLKNIIIIIIQKCRQRTVASSPTLREQAPRQELELEPLEGDGSDSGRMTESLNFHELRAQCKLISLSQEINMACYPRIFAQAQTKKRWGLLVTVSQCHSNPARLTKPTLTLTP